VTVTLFDKWSLILSSGGPDNIGGMSPRIHSVGYISLDYSKSGPGAIRDRFVRLIRALRLLPRSRGRIVPRIVEGYAFGATGL
jgi:hypothetical protein